MENRYIKKILSAKVYDVAVETPETEALYLSKRLKNKIILKREDLQPVFSFKIRGAYNCMQRLSVEEKKNGVIAASAGNHAQGVALAAAHLGIKAVIVMPVTTPAIKVQSVKSKKAKVILYGDNFDEACSYALDLSIKENYTFIHPYDDPDVIAGQGTIAMEVMRGKENLPDAVFVPVGGGGLLAGMAVYIKYLDPAVKIYGVEPLGADCLNQAIKARRRVKLSKVPGFADGVAVRQIGKETFKLIEERVDGVITVSTDEICAAIKDIYDDTRAITEPAGALAVAGIKKYVRENNITDKTLLAVNSGANINFDRLRYIAERTQMGELKEAIFSVEIPEKPGSFRRFCRDLHGKNITEFNYRFADDKKAHVFVGIEMNADLLNRKKVCSELINKGYRITDLTMDEVAKVHIRHMVGGRAPGISNEHLFSFSFPERPGALMHFLNSLKKEWNISLFHYRNHGAAFGRVLVGLQFNQTSVKEVKKALNTLGYDYKDESNNPAYEMFL